MANGMLTLVLSTPLIVVVLLIGIAKSFAPGAEYPEPKGYVNDFGNVIGIDTSHRLNALCIELDQKAHAQIAIVTIESLGGIPLEDFATSLFNKWGVGHKDDDRGILILLALSDRKSRLEIGRGVESLFPNERAAKLVAEMVPDLKQQHYDQALLRCTRTVAMIVAQERGVKLHELDSSPHPTTR